MSESKWFVIPNLSEFTDKARAIVYNNFGIWQNKSDLDVVIDDVVMIGSIANYNWSEYSDIDLHIIIDFNQFPKESKSLYIEFFDLKKIVF